MLATAGYPVATGWIIMATAGEHVTIAG